MVKSVVFKSHLTPTLQLKLSGSVFDPGSTLSCLTRIGLNGGYHTPLWKAISSLSWRSYEKKADTHGCCVARYPLEGVQDHESHLQQTRAVLLYINLVQSARTYTHAQVSTLSHHCPAQTCARK